MSHKQIYYSDKYDDEKYEYRHVMLPKDIAKRVPKTHLMSETEWRNLGVQQSQGWVHYMIHQPVAQGCCICCLARWLDSGVSRYVGSNVCVSSRSMCNLSQRESKKKI
ncbi:Cyclin-dependent kinases regulatory subunit 1 [Liparis tanakae]|uniref:Cyclin-dependent kinases regulatory subunit n=1 Tax=Liparis tanakae TaxID=230148 RepID=A0A4Z2HTJ0_9TELE|nr:Cyclin-dependent kinases regulatory subunit 1 [Liparis tanakae]